MNNIVETAIQAGSFKTLVEAVKAANLVDILSGSGPLTVFAPAGKLSEVLTYHVIPGKVMASEVIKLHSAKTVQGQCLKITSHDGVKIDDAKVITTDIQCSNGVIHVIDSVVLPKSA